MTPLPKNADVLIVGSGIMGSIVARRIREQSPSARIVMVEGGGAIGSTPGTHLHDVAERDLWERYNGRVASGIQGFYAGAEHDTSPAASLADLEPGLHLLTGLGEGADRMPRAAAAWNVGGMGAHWTAAVPSPHGEEVFDFGDPERFARDLRAAQHLLHATSGVLGPTAPGRIVLAELERRYRPRVPSGRPPQSMPMAAFDDATRRRVGPAVIFPPIGGAPDARFHLVDGHLATMVLHDEHRAYGVRLRRVSDGAEMSVGAASVVVCADAFRTPQLLFASGIRPPALGRHLNEHAFVTGRVLMDLDRFGLRLQDLPPLARGEFAVDSLWLPHAGPAQPFHGQIMNTTYADDTGAPLGYGIGVSLYTPVESRADNRLRFIDGEDDLTGMPRFEIDFAYSDRDRQLIEQARRELAEIFGLFGDFDPQTESAVLPPGSSLHQTGTVRMGPTDDGSSVCDTDGRVWGFDNLLLAGNGVVPTALAANATLTGAVTAVRAADAVARHHVTAAV